MEKSRNSCILEVEEDLLDRPNGLPPPLLPPLMVPFCCCCSFLAFLSSLKIVQSYLILILSMK